MCKTDCKSNKQKNLFKIDTYSFISVVDKNSKKSRSSRMELLAQARTFKLSVFEKIED